jgi:pectin methylesterase-like acyl-CoA thioesterase
MATADGDTETQLVATVASAEPVADAAAPVPQVESLVADVAAGPATADPADPVAAAQAASDAAKASVVELKASIAVKQAEYAASSIDVKAAVGVALEQLRANLSVRTDAPATI